MKEDWWVGDKPGESPQDEPPAVLENDEILILKANSQWVNPLGIFIISFGASGYVTNTISELDFFPDPYLYYFGLFLSYYELCLLLCIHLYIQILHIFEKVSTKYHSRMP